MLEHESLYTYICKGFIMHFLGTLIALSIVGHHCCRSSWWLHGKTHTIERYEMHGFCYTPWERSWHGISHTAWFLPWGMGFVMLHELFHVLPYMTLGKRWIVGNLTRFHCPGMDLVLSKQKDDTSWSGQWKVHVCKYFWQSCSRKSASHNSPQQANQRFKKWWSFHPLSQNLSLWL